MKFGRRRNDEPTDGPLAAADPGAPRYVATGAWTAPAADAPLDEPAVAEPPEPEPAVAEPVEPELAVAEPAALEPAVDSEAIELVGDHAPPPGPPAPPVAASLPNPVAGHAPPPAGAAPPPIADGPALPGSAAPSSDGRTSDPLMDEIKVLSGERPEIVVGAAFAGGVLAAMILRRLGN
jgi:Wiskott-Aldrich syndrome protein